MDKAYQPGPIEAKWAALWEQLDLSKPSGHGLPYCIMIPPPNVTGTLHMGHAFQDTIMDTLIRYHRMLGDNTLWQMGTDHAGIATQMVVERQLLKEQKTRHELGREAFIQKVWEWKAHSGGTINQQLKRLGASVDWNTERFTMDEGLSQAVQEVFIQLYEEGLIYRGQRLVNWDPTLCTAVSDLEVITEEEAGSLWHLRYPLVDDPHTVLVVATTRPETLFGDVAVAVHPLDARYQALIGKQVRLPLTERTIPIIGDPFVEMSFGTGCVKITPAHDFNDFEVGLRHQLSPINIFTKRAELNTAVPPAYRGLNRFKARSKVIAELETLNLLEKTESHTLQIPRGDRSNDILEPYLTDQWFVRTSALAEPAMEVVRTGAVRFVPEHWDKTYFEWLSNIQDWCISRQLWWGHRIPAWYSPEGQLYVGRSAAEVRAKHQLGAETVLTQDEDVLDTWFSSALWPFSTLGWPERTPRLATFYPTNVLVTGFDIIFFWVARMIMFGLKFTKQIPFQTVYLHGLILDQEGQKMSKSKGNILDPIDLIDGITLEALITKRTQGLMQPQMAEKITKKTRQQFPNGIAPHGTDALRFTLCALATHGRFIRFDIKRLEGYRNFCNKLWNATRFVMLQIEGAPPKACSFSQLALSDRWIFSQLNQVITTVHQHFHDYRFDLLAQTLYDFIWNIYCDWYLEFAKLSLQNPTSPDAKQRTQFTLITVLAESLKLLHPIMPFITEELWEKVGPCLQTTSPLMTEAYPKAKSEHDDPIATSTMTWLQGFILAIRNIRGEMGIAPSQTIQLLLQHLSPKQQEILQSLNGLWQPLTQVSSYKYLKDDQTIPLSVTQPYGEALIAIPFAGNINLNDELSRLHKALERTRKEHDKIAAKLANSDFTARAPSDVISEHHLRLEETRLALERLGSQLEKIQEMIE